MRRNFIPRRRSDSLGSFVAGLAFAFGWTPCIGPVLAAILAIAAQQDTIGKGLMLLSVYSLGLGIPFLVTSLSINAFLSIFQEIQQIYQMG